MRTVTRLGALALLIGAGIGVWSLRSTGAEAAIAIGSDVAVSGATPEQVEMVRWAVGRFEAAGLEAPPVEIRFHGDAAGCGGHLGYAKAGKVDVCTTLVNTMARRNLLHEMSHIWLDVNAGPDVRERFLELRDLSSWNASADAWEFRGYEQGAEIISWAIGERILSAQVPDDDPAALEAGFETLTGTALPTS